MMFIGSKQIIGMFNPFLVTLYISFVLIFIEVVATIVNVADYNSRQCTQAQN